MKVDVSENGEIRIREAFVGLLFETSEGNQYGICMRDNTIEVMVVGNAPVPRIFQGTGKPTTQDKPEQNTEAT